MMPGASERDGAIIPADVLPSDAEGLDIVIDRRFKSLLAGTVEAKDLTKALEAAAKWWEVRHGKEVEEQWGGKLGRTTRDD